MEPYIPPAVELVLPGPPSPAGRFWTGVAIGVGSLAAVAVATGLL